MRACLLFFSLFLLSHTYGQTIDGLVIDLDQNPVARADVYDSISRNKTTTDESGFFKLNVKDSFALKISHSHYLTESFELTQTSSKQNAVYVLTERIQLVEGVTVSSERIETVVDQRNINVIDYLPFDEALLVLKSHKGKRLLSIEGQDTTYRTFNLDRLKPSQIFLDCFENIHLLTKDSSYQIWMDTTLSITARSSIKEFNYMVKPCVAEFDQSQVFGNFTNHNKKYTLTSIHAETHQKEHFLHIYDEVGESVARGWYYEIIGRYFLVTPEHENIILSGAWSGDLMELPSMDAQLDRMINWYLKVRAKELHTMSFQYNNYLLNIDQYSDSIRIYNNDNKRIHVQHHNFNKSERTMIPLMDRSTGNIYELFMENGVFTIREIPLTDKRARKELRLNEAPFCKRISIHNDWVYFMTKENDFYQINRVLITKK